MSDLASTLSSMSETSLLEAIGQLTKDERETLFAYSCLANLQRKPILSDMAHKRLESLQSRPKPKPSNCQRKDAQAVVMERRAACGQDFWNPEDKINFTDQDMIGREVRRSKDRVLVYGEVTVLKDDDEDECWRDEVFADWIARGSK